MNEEKIEDLAGGESPAEDKNEEKIEKSTKKNYIDIDLLNDLLEKKIKKLENLQEPKPADDKNEDIFIDSADKNNNNFLIFGILITIAGALSFVYRENILNKIKKVKKEG